MHVAFTCLLLEGEEEEEEREEEEEGTTTMVQSTRGPPLPSFFLSPDFGLSHSFFVLRRTATPTTLSLASFWIDHPVAALLISDQL